MKKIIFTALLMILPWVNFAQTIFNSTDIEDEWKSTSGYSIKINQDGRAVLSSLGTTKFPTKLLHNLFYSEVTHTGNNTWSARRFQWKFQNGDMENGRWTDEGMVQITMSSDKNTIVEGPRTFNRVKPLKAAISDMKPGSKAELIRNYEGVDVKYNLIKTETGKTHIIVKATNNNTQVAAILSFHAGGKNLKTEAIDPGVTHTTKIPFEEFTVQVGFKAYNASDANSTSLIKWIQYKMTDKIINEGGGLKVKDASSGVRG